MNFLSLNVVRNTAPVILCVLKNLAHKSVIYPPSKTYFDLQNDFRGTCCS